MESDDDQRVVDHLSPQTLLETPPDNEVQYSFRSPEGKPFNLTVVSSIFKFLTPLLQKLNEKFLY